MIPEGCVEINKAKKEGMSVLVIRELQYQSLGKEKEQGAFEIMNEEWSGWSVV